MSQTRSEFLMNRMLGCEIEYQHVFFGALQQARAMHTEQVKSKCAGVRVGS